jgi:hypothetical protein
MMPNEIVLPNSRGVKYETTGGGGFALNQQGYFLT